MKLHASGEDYLEAMLILQRQMEESAVNSTWIIKLIWNILITQAKIPVTMLFLQPPFRYPSM